MGTAKAFPLSSTHCREAALALKTNPVAFAHSPLDIIRLFPNINLIADDMSRYDVVDALPDTVTGVVLEELNFATLVPSTLKFADRIVEVHCGHWTHDTQADLALFPNLTRLNVFASHGVFRSNRRSSAACG